MATVIGNRKQNRHQKCRNCGGLCPHKNGRTSCPAYGTVRFKCGKTNNYAQYSLSTASQGRADGNKAEQQPQQQEQLWRQQLNDVASNAKANKKNLKRNRKHINHVSEDGSESSSDDSYVFNASINKRQTPRATVKVCDVPINQLIDSGSSVNILDPVSYQKIAPAVPLQLTNTKVYPHGTGQTVPIRGLI